MLDFGKKSSLNRFQDRVSPPLASDCIRFTIASGLGLVDGPVLGVDHGVVRHVLVHVGLGADHDVVADGDLTDDAGVGTNGHVIADADVAVDVLGADGGVLAQAQVAADDGPMGDHDADTVREADAGTDLGGQPDVDVVLADQASIDALGPLAVIDQPTRLVVQVLRDPEPEHIVVALLGHHPVEQGAELGAAIFLGGDFLGEVGAQFFEIFHVSSLAGFGASDGAWP